MVKFEERDVFMSHVHQQEIRDRMQSDEIDIPQLFVDGQYIGVSSLSNLCHCQNSAVANKAHSSRLNCVPLVIIVFDEWEIHIDFMHNHYSALRLHHAPRTNGLRESRIWSQKPQELMQLETNSSIIAFYLSFFQNADHVERLNELGELRTMLKPFKVSSSCWRLVFKANFDCFSCSSAWTRLTPAKSAEATTCFHVPRAAAPRNPFIAITSPPNS